jgi:hypothetical protein
MRSDITWVKNGVHFLIKKSMADQIGRGAIVSMGYIHWASCPVIALCCKPTVSMAAPAPPFSLSHWLPTHLKSNESYPARPTDQDTSKV